MITAVSDKVALVIMTFSITADHLAWIDREAKRQVADKPGTRPNRSEVLRGLLEKAMRASESEAA